MITKIIAVWNVFFPIIQEYIALYFSDLFISRNLFPVEGRLIFNRWPRGGRSLTFHFDQEKTFPEPMLPLPGKELWSWNFQSPHGLGWREAKRWGTFNPYLFDVHFYQDKTRSCFFIWHSTAAPVSGRCNMMLQAPRQNSQVQLKCNSDTIVW